MYLFSHKEKTIQIGHLDFLFLLLLLLSVLGKKNQKQLGNISFPNRPFWCHSHIFNIGKPKFKSGALRIKVTALNSEEKHL